MELRRVLRGDEPEIEATMFIGSTAESSTFQAVHVVTPSYPADPESQSRILALDVIEHVEDEQAWLEELTRLLAPGGEIFVRVPAEGPMAWLDAPNIYRYLTEFTDRGAAPHETKPTGWHRHYRRSDLIDLIKCRGLRITSISQENTPLPDIAQLIGLVAGDLVLGHRDTETRLIAIRDKLDRRGRGLPLGKLGTRLRVTAVKPG